MGRIVAMSGMPALLFMQWAGARYGDSPITCENLWLVDGDDRVPAAKVRISPLCKGRQGGVEAPEAGSPSTSPPPPPDSYNRGEGTPLGTTHVLPSTHTVSGRAI